MVRIAPSFSKSVPFFRPRRAGPECTMEDCLIHHVPSLFESEHPNWMAGSVPLGAGLPDLIFASYQSLVTGLAEAGAVETNILAYLRVVRRARPETIATRLRLSQRVTEQRVRMLLEVKALTDSNGAVALTPDCRDLLPKVTAIEVKVENWQRALSQALRNQIFAHRSFVALPVGVAARANRAPVFLRSGIGIIGVDADGGARLLKKAAYRQPRVWSYYYRLATLIGQHVAKDQ